MPSGWIDPSRRASVRSYGPHANVKRSLLIGSFLAQSHRNYLKQKSSRAANAVCSLPRLRGRGGEGCPERPYHVAPPPCPSPASGGGDDVAPPVRTLYSRNLPRFAQALDQRGAQQKRARELGIFRGPAQL